MYLVTTDGKIDPKTLESNQNFEKIGDNKNSDDEKIKNSEEIILNCENTTIKQENSDPSASKLKKATISKKNSDQNFENSNKNLKNSKLETERVEEMSVNHRKNKKTSENISELSKSEPKSKEKPLKEYEKLVPPNFEISKAKKVFYKICDIFDLKLFHSRDFYLATNFRNFKKTVDSNVKYPKNNTIKNTQNNNTNSKNTQITSKKINDKKTETKETSPKKSLIWAYVWWLFGGIFGLHLFYLERDAHGFLTWSTFGGYGIGWLADAIRIPRYVREYNEDQGYLQDLYARMRKSRKPPFSTSRFISAITVGYLWGQMVMLAIPEDEVRGINLNTYLHWCIPLATALGVWTVGNIGKECGKPWLTILVTYLTYSSRWYFFDESIWLSIMVFTAALAFDGYSKEWRYKKKEKKTFLKRLAVIGICAALYVGVWSSYLYFNGKVTDSNGDEIPLHEALHHFFTSRWWTDLKNSLYETYQYAQHHGWYEIWRQIIDLSDPQGEQNAYKILDVSPTASQTEITARWRKLSREFHPDKVKDPALQRQAQEKFMEIQQAYEILSNIKNKRRRKNKKSVERDEEHEL